MSLAVSPGCAVLARQIVWLGEAFIWVALVAAVLMIVVDTVVKLAPLFEKKAFPAGKAAVAADPIKLIEALKNLIDALSKAPAWVAIFLAGLALLWAGSALVPDICKVIG